MDKKVKIIIPFYNNHDTIERLIDSIKDQDYKDYEVMIVADGKKNCKPKELKKLVKGLDGFNCFISEENKGASMTRNLGVELLNVGSKDILFFIDADCQLYPGMLRECVTHIEENPDVDFVYGNYRFDNRYEFYSNDFDPKLLETMNYISTMSPMKAEVFFAVGGFRDMPYFQDWDFFYNAAKLGFKGKYINEFIFSTKMPEKGDISAKEESLDIKSKLFREKNNIKDKKIVCTTYAAPLQAVQRAEMLGCDYAGIIPNSKRAFFPVNLAFKNWKYTYFVGCFNEPLQALENHMNVVWGKPIYHFIGSDIFQMYNRHSMNELEGIAEAFRRQGAILFANSPRGVQELNKCGIKAKLLYTPIYQPERFKPVGPLPEKFTVGVYYSDENPAHALDGANQHSNIPLITDVAKSMPDIQFKFFGGKAVEKKDNIEFCGKIPNDKMPEFINSCSMVIRSTIHDGFPQLPVQFMLCGRQALVSVPDKSFKFAEKLSFEDVLDYEKAKEEIIGKIYDMTKNTYSFLDKNDKVRKYYTKLMSEKKFKKVINRVAK